MYRGARFGQLAAVKSAEQPFDLITADFIVGFADGTTGLETYSGPMSLSKRNFGG